MAYNFLNRTTYSNDPLAQGDFEQFVPQSQSTPLGSGFSDNSFDSDLIEMVASDEQDPTSPVQQIEQLPSVDEQEESDPQVDWEIMNMIFEEAPEAAPRTRSYTPPTPTQEDEEEEITPTPAPSRTKKVKPRIWQYGGQPTKYQFDNTLHADTYEQQRIGLNDPNYNTAIFSTKGTNTFRGLDSHQPVMVTDGKKYQILNGPKDTAKFTGKVYEQKMQFGGELRPETNEVKEFYNNYLNSTNYTKRLNEQGYTNPQQAILDRLANIKSVTTSKDDLIGSQYNAPNYTVFYNPKEAAEFGFPMQSVLAHEYGHSVGASQGKYLVNPNLELNQNEMNAFSTRNKLRFANTANMTEQQKLDLEHDSRPSESKADLDALRFRLFKDKMYNTGTQEFNPELLKQAKEKYKDDNIVNRLFQNYSDEDLIYLMNHVAKNDNSVTTMAQTGGEITDVKQFYTSYYNSPNYAARRKNTSETGTPTENLNRLLKSKIVPSNKGSYEKNGKIGIDKKDLTTYNIDMGTLLSHEYSHPNPLNATEKGLINTRNNLFDFPSKFTSGQVPINDQSLRNLHDSQAHEFKADMDALRYNLYKDKVYNTGTQQFDQKTLDKAKQLYKKNGFMDRLFKRVKDKDLIYLMNTIAQNDNNTQSEIYG